MSEKCKKINEQQLAAVETTQNLTAKVAETEVDAADVAAEAAESKEDLDSSVEIIEPSETDDAAPIVVEVKDIADDILSIAMDTANIDKIDDAEESGEIIVLNDSTASETKEEDLPKTTEQPMEIVEDATKFLEDNTTKKPAEAENEHLEEPISVKSTAVKDLEQEQAMDIDAEVIAATDDKVVEETFDKQIENKDILLDNEANAISHMSSEMNDSHDSNQLIVDEKVHDAAAAEECEHDAEQTATDAVTAAEPMDIEEAPSKNESDENMQPTNNENNEATTANTMKVGDEGTTFTFTNNTQILDVIEIDDDDDDDGNNEDETNEAATPTVEMTTIEAAEETTKLETAADTSGQKTTNIETSITTTTISSSASATAVQEETNQTALTVKEDMNDKQQQAANDVEQLPSKASAEIYYNKECINLECKQGSKEYYFAPDFALVFYKVRRKKPKIYFICGQCFDFVVEKYRHYSLALYNEQLLLLEDVNQRRQEFVEIIDSSDDDEADENLQQIEKSLEACTISLVERELQLSLKNVLEKVNIPIQLAGYRQKLKARSTKLIEDNAQIDEELRELQKKADKMNERLSNSVKVKHRALPAWDLNTNRPFNFKDGEALPTLLPTAELRYPAVQINEIYYTVKKQSIGSWVECRVIEQLDMQSWALKSMPHYKVKLIIGQQSIKVVPLKNLAYFEPPPVRLPIGARVIAYFDASFLMHGKEKVVVPSAFYPGIVAEPLQAKNKHRYLIFYDDGYTQYVQHKHVRLVCHESENPWDDVHPNSKEFIKKYINESTTNRPMVQTQKGQSMSVELNGKWTYGRVLAIDSSLVLMQFEGAKNYTEWIYRGSARLGPINRETKGDAHMSHVSRMPRQRTMPFVRYTDDEDKINNQAAAVAAAAAAQASMDRSNEPRAVARKSTSSTATLPNQNQNQVPTVRHLNNSTIYLEDDNKPKGKVVYYTAKRNIPPLRYKRHRCSPSCLIKITHNLNAYSPLAKPLLSGWERLVFRQRIKKVVTYRGPCGKIMRNMSELHVYLRLTDNVLNVDNFDFNAEINCLAEYVIDTAKVLNRDISDGQEKMVIPLVNYYDESLPPDCKYAAQRIPTKGVPLNLDPDFLVCCDCVDDCSNKDKCACWQLTLQGVKYGNPNTPIDQIGYQYKRLLEHVPTGIYECNSRCKCKQNCLNRVAQQPLQMKLQVFKTSNRGWGLRCLNDIARGSFICIYAGYLLNETTANEGGQDAGDEYFAELDYIEVVEQMKEGYESDVRYSDEEEEEVYAPEVDDDDDFRPSKSFMTRSKRASNSNSGAERQPRNFDPNKDMDNSSLPETSIRRFYGKDETCYIMDAKITGNLGRYFNHSCSPNLFVQNVFVDTHDLRFPWVAFFASTNIRAGTELTWNYNYEVGVVPGKVLYCQCGASNCRIRLL